MRLRCLAAALAIGLLVPAWPARAEDLGSSQNAGQTIVAQLAREVGMFWGESGNNPSVIQGSNYRLDDVALGGSTARCAIVDRATNSCVAVRVILATALLVQGETYHFSFLDQDLGYFTATGLDDRIAPVVVGVDVTQFDLTVRFSEPMSHDGDCDGYSSISGPPSLIGTLRAVSASERQPSGYSSPDPTLDAALGLLTQATLGPDCSSVSFHTGWALPEGRYRLTISTVTDLAGNAVIPATVMLDIPDAGAPTLRWTDAYRLPDGGSVVTVHFDEPMDQEIALDPGSYLIDGEAVPDAVEITCAFACTWVRFAVPQGALPSGDHAIDLSAVRDIAGNGLDPLDTADFTLP